MAAAVSFVAGSLWTTLAAVLVLGFFAVVAGIGLGMTGVGATGLYFIVWWMMLFVILPIRIRSQVEAGEIVSGSEPGAPHDPALRQRAIWTSIASAILFVGIAAAFPFLSGL